MFIDTHAHLYFDDLSDQLESVVNRALEESVKYIICVGTDLASSKASIAISEKFNCVYSTVGIHPHDAKDAPSNFLDILEEMILHPKVVGLGEMGLDYFRNHSSVNQQYKVFHSQLLLAKKLDVPAVIHNRNADEDLLSIVKEISPRKAVIHCFSSDVAVAKRAIKAGCHLSFTGNITFGNNHTESVLRVIPIEKIMLETDCPFLAPVPNRGKLNEPSTIPHIAKKIAEIKEIELGDVANLTSTTAQNFFGLPY